MQDACACQFLIILIRAAFYFVVQPYFQLLQVPSVENKIQRAAFLLNNSHKTLSGVKMLTERVCLIRGKRLRSLNKKW